MITEAQHKETVQNIDNTIADLVGAFLYYDRKEDEDLPRGTIEKAIECGSVSVEDIVTKFEQELRSGLKC